MGVWLFSTILMNWRTQSWAETPAIIVRAKLESHSSTKGGTTYQATAEYTYQYEGQKYTGNRVGIQGGSDNFGSFQQDVYRQLSQLEASRRPFRCYVNPEQPSEAILFRDLRWEMVAIETAFATLFGATGFGLLVAAVFGYCNVRGDSALAALHPDEPWLHKKNWADGKISSSAKTYVFILLLVAIYWNVMSIPACLAMPHDVLGPGNRLALLLLAFPAIGLILILCLIVSVLRWRKYGQSVFEMASVPGVIGGRLVGVIRTSAKVKPEDGFRLSLKCIQQVSGGSSENVLWQDEQVIARELRQNDPERSAIPVLFQIPYECRPTDVADPNNQSIWRLKVSAKTPGLDYSTSFDVPVFKTSGSDPKFVVNSSLIAEYAAPDDLDRDLREAGVIKMASPSGDGCRLVFPMLRNPGMASLLALLGIIFCGAPFLMFHLGAGWWVTAMFSLGFWPTGLLFLAVGASVCFYRSTVDASASGLTFVGGFFGLDRELRIKSADVKSIVLTSRMYSGAKRYYDIDVICTTDKTVTVGKRIPDKRLALSVIRQIEQAMGRQ
jgi:hypothetical protein